MKFLSCCFGLLALLLAGCETTGRAPQPFNREVHFTGSYNEDRDVAKPVALSMAPPVFPSEFRQTGIHAQAEVWFIIGVDGKTEEVQVKKATDEAFAAAAIKAVSQWRFKPAMKNGVPVRMRTLQLIEFRVDPSRRR